MCAGGARSRNLPAVTSRHSNYLRDRFLCIRVFVLEYIDLGHILERRPQRQ